MSQEASPILTPEEQAELAENLPALLEAITKGSPVALGWLAHWRSKRTVREEAQEQANEIRQEVAAAPPEQGIIAQWCSFPTDMTRCSPFFPVRNNDLEHREFLQNYLITSANWGEILYTGPRLSTYDEDVLLVLLAILDGKSQYRERCDYVEGKINEINIVIATKEGSTDIPSHIQKRTSYTYTGPVYPLLRMLGYTKPSKKDYLRVISTLERLTVSALKISISTGKTKSGKRRSPRITQMSSMLAGVHWDDKKKELTATVNPFFYETYMAGRVTLMDVAKRMSLKGAISKALYRFVQSQRHNLVFEGHFLTLANALNMDREQPAWKVRQLLKSAINELIRRGVLMKKSGFVEQDIVKLNRAPEALPSLEKKKFATH